MQDATIVTFLQEPRPWHYLYPLTWLTYPQKSHSKAPLVLPDLDPLKSEENQAPLIHNHAVASS